LEDLPGESDAVGADAERNFRQRLRQQDGFVAHHLGRNFETSRPLMTSGANSRRP
jgi:hypothetical protein